MVYRMELTYDEIVVILETKYIAASTIGYTLPQAKYEISDINLMLKSLLPDQVKVNITIDNIRLKSNLTNIKITRFTRKSFFYIYHIRIYRTSFRTLGDIERFVQLLPGSYKSDGPINITGTDKIHLKCDCIDGSIINGIREPILYSFALDKSPGHKIYNEPRVRENK